ncbi:MAG: cobyric acid synthase [Alphaproteobacteria bacterium]
MAAALMLQGTGSDVGKSLLVAGLARAYTRRGLAVRPFKPQNMSNNAALATVPDAHIGPDGNGIGEIGRAQALQARACGVGPTTDMNPVLLKPQSESGAQVIVHGQVRGNVEAREFHDLKPKLLPAVLESFAYISAEADLVIAEGAGSPAEVNLRRGDIANMGFATMANVPVVLVGDIERGGVIAALVGTWTLLSETERALLRGYIVNKFRGDVSLFDDAPAIIERHTDMPSLGVVPWFDAAARLPAEDSGIRPPVPGDAIHIVVPRLPRIANFDDLDPLAAEPDVILEFVAPGQKLPKQADLYLLPGSKATRADLSALREAGWDKAIADAVATGARVLGICGGYQMLGRAIADPDGTEGSPGADDGLGLLDIETEITRNKTLAAAVGRSPIYDSPVEGYEMHMGRTKGPDTSRPLLALKTHNGLHSDGAVSADGRVAGCYMHGLFTCDAFRDAFLRGMRADRPQGARWQTVVDDTLDALADHLDACVDLDALLAIAQKR